jgi:hypothetical protein
MLVDDMDGPPLFDTNCFDSMRDTRRFIIYLIIWSSIGIFVILAGVALLVAQLGNAGVI